MLKEFIQSELEKLKNEDYLGSSNQIKNEDFIYNKTNIEMKYNETIEEYYKRINDGI